MNKMNIPAPFRMALPTPPLPAQVPAPPPPPPPQSITMKPQTEDLSSSESEMDSSDDVRFLLLHNVLGCGDSLLFTDCLYDCDDVQRKLNALMFWIKFFYKINLFLIHQN